MRKIEELVKHSAGEIRTNAFKKKGGKLRIAGEILNFVSESRVFAG